MHASANGMRRYYHRWQALKRRCYNPRANDYRYYGGRGVTMHPPWVESYKAFYDWLEEKLGPCPAKHVLKRIDTDGDFVPGNLRWASHKDMSRGRGNVFLDLDAARRMRAARCAGATTKTIAQEAGVSQHLVDRVLRGEIWQEAA